MSDPVILALIGLVGTIATAVLGLVNTFLMRKVSKEATETKEAMVLMEKNTNSKFSELVKVTGEAQRAVGKLEGAAEQKAEQR